jgi:GxxExxY protein
MNDNDITHQIIGAAIEVHRLLGPGLLESAYEECLSRELELRSLKVERQKPIPVVYKDVKLECGYRIDLLVESRIVVELKSIEAFAHIHEAIILTYIRLSGCRLGLLINFNVTVLKDGIKRYINFSVVRTEEEHPNTEITERRAQRTRRNTG